MKILHIAAGELLDGATRGTYWLHQAQLKIGINSKMVISGRNDDSYKNVFAIGKSYFERIKFSLISHGNNIPLKFYQGRKKYIFSTGLIGIDITKLKEYREADIVHMHWINNLTSVKSFKNINKPIVWTMRDMWPFTGGCHVSMECLNYKFGCGNCQQLESHNNLDLSRLILNQKKKYFSKNMKIIGISNWLSNEAKKSELFKGFDIRTISNNINTDDFFPIEKSIAKEILKIKTKKKIILIGALNHEEIWKGFKNFLEIAKQLDKDKFFLCFFGKVDEKIIKDINFDYKNLGYLKDDVSLRLAYSCADVFVSTSLQEAFGKTIAEAQSCGIPVVCYDTSGQKDIVDHKLTGYKSKNFKTENFVKGIEWIVNLSDDQYYNMAKRARKKMINEFDSEIIANQYKKIYEEILLNHAN